MYRNRQGATAVEFGFIAGPLFLLICGLLQVGYYYYTLRSLDYVAAFAARLVMTNATNPGYAAAYSIPRLSLINYAPRLCCRNADRRYLSTSG